jgi:guanine deaminase
MSGTLTALRGPLLTPRGDDLRAVADAVVRWDPVTGSLIEVDEAPSGATDALDLRSRGLIVPGFVDAHVHLPQYRVRGRFRGALMPWLREHIWPEELAFDDRAHARAETTTFLAALAAAGTTTAAVFGSPHPHGVDDLLMMAGPTPWTVGGPALMDREGPPGLLLDTAATDGALRRLFERFGDRSVVTPRFAVSSTETQLDLCGAVARELGLRVQTHLSENPDEIALVARQFPDCRDYTEVYERAGLIGPRTLLAHAVHCSDDEYGRVASAGGWIVHCPTSNLALGSGRMPLERVRTAGVGVCLGSDVGAGPDLCLLDVLRAFAEIHEGILPTDAAATLPLATVAGARALGLDDRGELRTGQRADLTILRCEDAGGDPAAAFDRCVRGYRTGEAAAVLATIAGGAPVSGLAAPA